MKELTFLLMHLQLIKNTQDTLGCFELLSRTQQLSYHHVFANMAMSSDWFFSKSWVNGKDVLSFLLHYYSGQQVLKLSKEVVNDSKETVTKGNLFNYKASLVFYQHSFS